MPVSRLSTSSGPGAALTEAAVSSDGGSRHSAPANPGQGFADLLLLAALACQTPVAVLSVPGPNGTWSTLSHGFEHRVGLNDPALFEVIAAGAGPVELADMVTVIPRSPLVQAPHAMRWGYGMAVRDASGRVVGVAAVMDRWLRQLTKREQRALMAVCRQMSGLLFQVRRPAETAETHSVIRPMTTGNMAPKSPTRGGGRASAEVGEAPQLLRSHEVATIFDVTERTVINWAAAGKLPSLRTIGGHLRFRRDDVMRLLSGAE